MSSNEITVAEIF